MQEIIQRGCECHLYKILRQSAKVKRSDSLRSEEETDGGQSSVSAENRRVSFNADVTVKKIPKSRLTGLIGGNRGAGSLIDAASRPTFSTFKVRTEVCGYSDTSLVPKKPLRIYLRASVTTTCGLNSL